jgi:alcohol dehydrogenase (NADP+)
VITVNARCTCGAGETFKATTITRRDPGPNDVLIDIAYAGICHSDIEHARSTRGRTMYPLVPGHEIAGIVSAVGLKVTKFAVGDRAGVGNMVDSCRVCEACRAGLEQYCSGGRVLAYNAIGRDGQPTHGGYSQKILVDERFAVRIPAGIPLQNAAPLFCAGITMYSPLRHWKAGPGKRVAIVGFGGLGHVGVQISKALGAHTTVLDLSRAKHDDARRLGADEYRVSTDAGTFAELASSFDLIVSTVPATLDLDGWLGLLARDGTLVTLSIPGQRLSLSAVSLLNNRRSLAGTRSGGLPETQEMIDFCAAHGIGAEVEVINADRIDEAYERLLAGDVRYRFVIDTATMAKADPTERPT